MPDPKDDPARWVDERLALAQAQPWVEPSAGFARALAARLAATPRARRGTGALRWAALAAALLLVAALATRGFEGADRAPAPSTRPARLALTGWFSRAAPEDPLAREWRAIVADARTILDVVSEPLPRWR